MATPIITVDDVVVSEASAFAVFTVRLSEVSASNVSVTCTNFNNTALNGSDYSAISQVVTIVAGQLSATVQVPIINNAILEGRENFSLSLSSPVGGIIGGDGFAWATIVDNDAVSGTPTARVSDGVVDEADGRVSFVVTLDKPSAGPVTINYATANGTALAGTDYVANTGTLIFAAGETAKTIVVDVINDGTQEGDERFNLVLSAPSGATLLDATGTATVTANDGPTVGTPVVTVADIVVSEADTFAEFVVRLSAPSASAVTVNYTMFNNTALNGSDYSAFSGALRFEAGETSKVLKVPILNDAAVEGAENFDGLFLSSATGATIGGKGFAWATIVDNDAVSGTPTARVSDGVVDEADGRVSFVVTLDKPSAGPVTINYATANGTALAGTDYVANTGTLIFAAGETAKTIVVDVINDGTQEGDERFNLVLSAPSGATLLDATGTATVTANDGPTVGTPVVTVADIVVSEADTFAEFVVRLSAPSASAVTVNYTMFNNTALNGSDYSAFSGALRFEAGETSKVLKVPILNDAAVEGAENFDGLFLSSATGATIGGKGFAWATIVDNDAVSGTPTARVSDGVVDEADGRVSFVVTLDKPSAGPVTINYATANGTALAGTDYVANTGTLIFAAGETAKTIVVDVINDGTQEGDERFNLVLSAPSGATLLDATGTATVTANDGPTVGTPVVTVADIVVSEADTFAEFVVRLSAPSASAVTVNYTMFNNTALNGSDYSAFSGALRFEAGETSKVLKVPILNDAAVEGAENFDGLFLSSATGATIGGKGFAWATIVDNDAVSGTPTARVSDGVVDEADGRVSFVVTLDKPSAGPVTINYATANGTALAGTDYVANTGTLIFAAGETAKTIVVDVINDGTQEGDERFNLVLSAPSGATLLDATGTATVTANDGPTVGTPVVTVADIVVSEADTFAEFVVRLSAPSASAVTVNYTMFNNTALNGSDYSAFSGALRFEAGETSKVLKVPLLENATVEGLENFYLSLTSATGAQIGKPAGMATIVDNDTVGGTPIVTLGDAVVDEKTGSAHITVTLDRASTAKITINMATQAVTAAATTDVSGLASTAAVFAPGETSKTVDLSVIDDALIEGMEVFDVIISSATGATVGDGRGHVIIDRSDAANAAPAITVANVAAAENDAFVEFKVMLSAPSTNAVSVNYANTNGTALNGSDYVATSGTLVFTPGETVRTVRIGLVDDTGVEATEAFNFNLSAAVNGAIGTASASATLVDNESAAPAAVIIAGTTQSDIIRGTRFADALTGGSGNDLLDGAGGNDSMDGGGGNDIFLVEQAGDSVIEAAGGGTDKVIAYVTHTLAANVEELLLAGTAAINGTGNTLNNTITGNAAINTINGGVGADNMAGAAGGDTYVVDNAGDVITELAAGGTDTVQSSVTHTLGAELENLTLTGAAAINGTGNTLANVIQGNAGNNVLNGLGGIDTLSYANAAAAVTVSLALLGAQNTGGAGTDTVGGFENLTGSNAADNLSGDSAANLITGGAGADTMAGAGGDDTYVVDTLSDVINEIAGGGIDTIHTALTYTLGSQLENLLLTGSAAVNGTGNTLDNVLTGNSAANTLSGLDGNDRLNGGTGTDNMIGGIGNDTYVVNVLADVVTEALNAGTDTVETAISYTLGANVENLSLTGTAAVNGTGNALDNTLSGTSGVNTLSGSDGADTLNGNGGNDILLGGIGNDRLVGGAGNDTLTGNAGLDKFVFNAALSATTNVDTVTDFTPGQDLLVLGKAVFTTLIGTNVPLDPTQFFTSASATAGADASDRVVYNTTTGNLYYDSDGVGGSASVLFAKLTAVPVISAANLFVEA